MKTNTQHTILATAIGVILCTGQLGAQESTATGASEQVEQISVVGIRSSITNSVARKQGASQVADVISVAHLN